MTLRPLTRILCITCMIALLASCFHMRRGDGPPGFYIDETKIPNAIPKPEPRAKYGNMTSYRIGSKRYHTLTSSDHFEQTGTASWYGTMFHDKRTSSGEKYDMLAMTAAHKTLPLPTYVEVTNLDNHRKIIVKVNDRGPFASNRIIDLSYVAAKKLGMLGRGTARVRIAAINPYTYAAGGSKAVGRSIRHAIYLQAGAFKNKTYAIKLRNRLANMLTFPVRVSHSTVNARLYRVQIGPIHDSAAAEQLSKKLKNSGIPANQVQGA